MFWAHEELHGVSQSGMEACLSTCLISIWSIKLTKTSLPPEKLWATVFLPDSQLLEHPDFCSCRPGVPWHILAHFSNLIAGPAQQILLYPVVIILPE